MSGTYEISAPLDAPQRETLGSDQEPEEEENAPSWLGEEPDVTQAQKLLIVEDEDTIREPLQEVLTEAGYHVFAEPSADAARALLKSETFDLLILDVMMPGEDGFSLCRHVRETYRTPIIMLTARGDEIDRILGLEMGADDYVQKPFSPRELVARIRAVLRRAGDPQANAAEPRVCRFGDWVVHMDQQVIVGADEVAIDLSTGEFTLLKTLLMRPRTVFSRDELLELTRGRTADVFDRSVDNMISRLRRKIERDPKNPKTIKTIWGGGYMFTEEVHAE